MATRKTVELGRMKIQGLYWRIRSSQVLSAGVWYLLLNLLQKAISFLSVILFVRLLTPEQYGTTVVFTTWIGIFATTITLNVISTIGRAKFDSEIADFNRFLGSLIALGMFSGLATTAVIALLPSSIVIAFFGLTKPYVLLATLTVVGSLGLDAVALSWQVEYKYQKYTLVRFIQSILTVIVPVLLILSPLSPMSSDPPWAKVVGTSAVGMTLGLVYAGYQLWSGRTIFDRQYWRYSLTFSIPLIPHVLSGIILAQSDRILINSFSGTEQAGLYSFAYQLGEVVYIVWLATNTAWSPWFYRNMAERAYSLIERRSTQYLRLFTVFTILMIVIGPILVRIAPRQYWASAHVIPLIMCSEFLTLLYSFYANVELYEKRTLYISLATAVATSINIGLNIILLPRYGYIAAAWTTLAAYIVLFFVHMWIVHVLIKPPRIYKAKEMLVWGSIIVTLGLIVYSVV